MSSPATQKKCAYCGSATSPLTNEHIIPRFISERRPERYDTFLASKKRFFSGDPQIGDVCTICNSGRLSALDSYAKTLWVDYFEKIAMPRDTVTSRYDFALLAPWLLKVSFNVARGEKNGPDAATLARYVPYILGDQSGHPPISTYLELLPAYIQSKDEENRTDPRDLKRLPRDPATGRTLLTPGIRPGSARYFGPSRVAGSIVCVRYLGLHSYFFYIILARKEVDESNWKKLRRNVRDSFPAAKHLDERGTELTITASGRRFFDSQAFHLARYRDAYEKRRKEHYAAWGEDDAESDRR